MFGALQFGQGYFAQGPPGTAVLEPAVTAELLCVHEEALTSAAVAGESLSGAGVGDEALSFARAENETLRIC